MTTLVVCLDRTGDIGRKADIDMPVAGWSRVRSLVTDIGLSDPEDSNVNAILEGLRITRSIREEGDAATVAVVSGGADSAVSADRAVARQLDMLTDRYNPTSAVVVLDSAEDEQSVPLVESRLPVDSVDRVVVRQARDLESTYYLLKQFLADEELRQTTLVPLGTALVVFPILSSVVSLGTALAVIVAVIGMFLLFKGLGIDTYLERLSYQTREALYSGQVSVVTYVVAAGLALLGAFFGALAASELPFDDGVLLPTMTFIYESVPWIAGAGLTAAGGRLLDETLDADTTVQVSSINLPFFILAVGLVVRGFAAYFLEQAGSLNAARLPGLAMGPLSVDTITLQPGEHLAVAVLAGILLSLIGVRLASYIDQTRMTTPEAEADHG